MAVQKKVDIGSFQGFSPETFSFLQALELNNEKEWFEENRENYQINVLQRVQQLVVSLSDFMLTIDSDFETAPMVDKTISRIYRDTRFSKDKSPYRPNVWIAFKRRVNDWKIIPTFYFEIFTDGYRYGMGFYNADKTYLQHFREDILANQTKFLEIVSFLKTSDIFTLEGNDYKKELIKGLPQDLSCWYQKKSFYLSCTKPLEQVLFEKGLSEKLKNDFSLLIPLYHYLWEIYE